MAGKSLLGAGGDATLVSASSTYYQPLICCSATAGLALTTPESENQTFLSGTGVISRLYVRIPTNSRTTTTTVRTRKNGANGNLSVSIGSGATGTFEDATNSDGFVNGDLYCAQYVTGTGSGFISIAHINVMHQIKTGNAITYIGIVGSSSTFLSTAVASTTNFAPLGGTDTVSTADSDNTTRAIIPCDGTISNMRVSVPTNGRSTATTVKSRKNGADGNMSISIAAGATGNFEDSSNSDSISSGDRMGYSFTTGTGAGTVSFRRIYVRFLGTNDETPYLSTGTLSFTTGTHYATPIGRYTTSVTVEANGQIKIPFDSKVTHVGGRASTFGSGGGSITLRKNGSNTSVTASTSSSGAATIEDTTHFEQFADGDLLSLAWNTTNASNFWETFWRLTDIIPRGRKITSVCGG